MKITIPKNNIVTYDKKKKCLLIWSQSKNLPIHISILPFFYLFDGCRQLAVEPSKLIASNCYASSFPYVKLGQKRQLCLIYRLNGLGRKRKTPIFFKKDKSYNLVIFFSSHTKKKNHYYLQLLKVLKKKIKQLFFGIFVGVFKQLDLNGVGYKAYFKEESTLLFKNTIKKKTSLLTLRLGFSHDIKILIPSNIIVDNNKKGGLVALKSFCENSLGSFLSRVERLKKKDVYKGKGVFNREKFIYIKKFKKK